MENKKKEYTLMSKKGDLILDEVRWESMIDCGSRSENYGIFDWEGYPIKLTQEELVFHGTDILVKGKVLEEALEDAKAIFI